MIEFKNVSFSYDGERPVVENLSFSIGKGEGVIFILSKGAVLQLLLGLLGGTGEILVDGLPVTKKNLPAVRQKLGFVLQDSDNQMFMPTVYEDMIFGPRNYGLSGDEAERRVDEVLA